MFGFNIFLIRFRFFKVFLIKFIIMGLIKENMKSQIEVSVIIPTFNRELLLQGCLDSLSSQTFPKHKFEVIVVDDCSNYDVSRLIKHSKIKDISLVSCRHHSGKPGFVRSLGIKKSKGRVIAFIDDDFVANPDWIEKIVYYHKQFKQELIIQGGLDVYYKYHLIGLLWKFILDVNIEKKPVDHADQPEKG